MPLIVSGLFGAFSALYACLLLCVIFYHNSGCVLLSMPFCIPCPFWLRFCPFWAFELRRRFSVCLPAFRAFLGLFGRSVCLCHCAVFPADIRQKKTPCPCRAGVRSPHGEKTAEKSGLYLYNFVCHNVFIFCYKVFYNIPVCVFKEKGGRVFPLSLVCFI